jgi:hypothetical protein
MGPNGLGKKGIAVSQRMMQAAEFALHTQLGLLIDGRQLIRCRPTLEHSPPGSLQAQNTAPHEKLCEPETLPGSAVSHTVFVGRAVQRSIL